MLKLPLAACLLALAGAPAAAQMSANPATVCPAGTTYATIRHDMVKPGQWSAFEDAVAAHNAWYASHGDTSGTAIARVVVHGALSTDEAVTISHYSDKPQPAHDAGWDAFTAKYRASSEVKDEVRLCVPAMH